MSLEPTAQTSTVTFGRTAMGVFRSSSFLLSKTLIALLIVVELVSPAVSLTLPMTGSGPGIMAQKKTKEQIEIGRRVRGDQESDLAGETQEWSTWA